MFSGHASVGSYTLCLDLIFSIFFQEAGGRVLKKSDYTVVSKL